MRPRSSSCLVFLGFPSWRRSGFLSACRSVIVEYRLSYCVPFSFKSWGFLQTIGFGHHFRVLHLAKICWESGMNSSSVVLQKLIDSLGLSVQRSIKIWQRPWVVRSSSFIVRFVRWLVWLLVYRYKDQLRSNKDYGLGFRDRHRGSLSMSVVLLVKNTMV